MPLILVLLLGALMWAEKPAKTPIVEWTVGDAPDFRYRFLERVETTELLHATPETGTFSHHGFLAYHKSVLFASWDSQARDENTSGQHGVFRYSTDEGETWSEAKPLFPPMADNLPASETRPDNPFQVSQGFVEIDGQLFAVTNIDRALEEKVYRFNEVSRIQVGLIARSVGVDGSLGEIFWLSETAPEPEPGFPAYPPGDPSLVAKLNAHFQQPGHLPQLMFRPRVHPDSADGHRMNEPTPRLAPRRRNLGETLPRRGRHSRHEPCRGRCHPKPPQLRNLLVRQRQDLDPSDADEFSRLLRALQRRKAAGRPSLRDQQHPPHGPEAGRSLDAGDLVVARRLEVRPLGRDSLS